MVVQDDMLPNITVTMCEKPAFLECRMSLFEIFVVITYPFDYTGRIYWKNIVFWSRFPL